MNIVERMPHNPDFHVYADLTTTGQAGFGGNHITGKLDRAGLEPGDAVAADITYDAGPAHAAQMPEWRRDAIGARQLHRKSKFGIGDAPYHP